MFYLQKNDQTVFNKHNIFCLESALKQLYNISDWLENHFTQIRKLSKKISREICELISTDNNVSKHFSAEEKLLLKVIERKCNEVFNKKKAPNQLLSTSNDNSSKKITEETKFIGEEGGLPAEGRKTSFQSLKEQMHERLPASMQKNLIKPINEAQPKTVLDEINYFFQYLKQKAKQYFEASEQGKLNSDLKIENLKDLKDELCDIQNKNTLLKNDIADAEEKIVRVFKNQSPKTTTIYSEELFPKIENLLSLFDKFKKNAQQQKQASAYMDEIGKWCERIANKMTWTQANNNQNEKGAPLC